MCESVKKILKFSPEATDCTQNTPQKSSTQDVELKKEFGHNIIFNTPKNLAKEKISTIPEKEVRNGDHEKAAASCEAIHDSLSEEEADGNDAFSKAFIDGMQTSKVKASQEKVKSKSRASNNISRQGDFSITMATDDHTPTPYTSEWLARQLQKGCVGESSIGWDELYKAVFDLLSSAQDNTLIQNDVSVTSYRFRCVN